MIDQASFNEKHPTQQLAALRGAHSATFESVATSEVTGASMPSNVMRKESKRSDTGLLSMRKNKKTSDDFRQARMPK